MMKRVRWSAGLVAIAALAAPAQLAPPVEWTADGKPMRGIYYPSPTLHDIDGDGTRELVIGDLRGYIQVAKPDGNGGWGPLEKLNAGNSKPIKLNNW